MTNDTPAEYIPRPLRDRLIELAELIEMGGDPKHVAARANNAFWDVMPLHTDATYDVIPSTRNGPGWNAWRDKPLHIDDPQLRFREAVTSLLNSLKTIKDNGASVGDAEKLKRLATELYGGGSQAEDLSPTEFAALAKLTPDVLSKRRTKADREGKPFPLTVEHAREVAKPQDGRRKRGVETIAQVVKKFGKG